MSKILVTLAQIPKESLYNISVPTLKMVAVDLLPSKEELVNFIYNKLKETDKDDDEDIEVEEKKLNELIVVKTNENGC